MAPLEARLIRSAATEVAITAASASVAALALRSRTGLVEPEAVDAASLFSDAQVARARAYRRGQLALAGASASLQAGVLAVLARRGAPRCLGAGRPRPIRGPGRSRADLVAAARAGTLLSVALSGVTLPLAVLAHRRARAYGLSVQGWRAWSADLAKALVLEGAGAAAGGAGAAALRWRYGPRWWLPASLACDVAAAALTLAAPVLLDPLFGRFERLPEGETRRDVLALAGEAGVRVGEVYTVDASRRTTAVNAYVTGLGPTKRVVLYDTLLETFTPAETRLVVAHELAHVRHRDVARGLAFIGLTAPTALRGASRVAPSPTDAQGLAALALALGASASVAGVAGRAISRAAEVRADVFALRATGERAAFESLQCRLAVSNLADPDPPRALTAALATHPSTVQRIGIARALARRG